MKAKGDRISDGLQARSPLLLPTIENLANFVCSAQRHYILVDIALLEELMSKRQEKNEIDVDAGTLLFIVTIVLFLPLVLAGFLFQ